MPALTQAWPGLAAVAWARAHLKKHRAPKGSIEATQAALVKTVAQATSYINRNHDVQGLRPGFHGFPTSLCN